MYMDQAWGWIMAAAMLLSLVAVIVIAVWLVRLAEGTRPRALTARETLDHRLASGQITADEYRQQLALLETDNKD